MNTKPTPMRMLNPKMIEGLRDLCYDIKEHFNFSAIQMTEVGCYIGESTDIFLNDLYLERINCIDLWTSSDKYHKDDIEEACKIFMAKFKYHSKIHIYQNSSTKVSVPLVHMTYIDASHKYKDVIEDILYWKARTRSDGIICGHDYEDKGKFGVKQAVDEIFGKPDKVYKDTSWMVKLK